MRITDQYFWNLVFLVFFLCLVFLGTIILQSETSKPFETLKYPDFALMMLATVSVVRLIVYDKIFAFFREQFYDVVESKGKVALVKPTSGPRRTIADLLSCSWCFGVWAAAMVSFFYLLTPYAFFPVLLLALSTVATLVQLVASLIGWKAEQAKLDVEGR